MFKDSTIKSRSRSIVKIAFRYDRRRENLRVYLSATLSNEHPGRGRDNE